MESDKNNISDVTLEKDDSDQKYKTIAGATILGMSCLSGAIAGLLTSHIAKKRHSEYLRELGKKVPSPIVLESGYSLAFRALAWGTLWAVGGCSLIGFGIWKFFGIKDLDDLRVRLRSNVKKSPPTDERTEFDSLSDFFNYITQKDSLNKKKNET